MTISLILVVGLQSVTYLRFIGSVNEEDEQSSVSVLRRQTLKINCYDTDQFARSVNVVIQFFKTHRNKWEFVQNGKFPAHPGIV